MWYESGKAITPGKADSLPVWRISEHICALADDERHLGHVVKTDRWLAFDATKLNTAENGFRYLGSFVNVTAAREAVEKSIPCASPESVRGAGQ
jgi:hypothetical protein